MRKLMIFFCTMMAGLSFSYSANASDFLQKRFWEFIDSDCSQKRFWEFINDTNEDDPFIETYRVENNKNDNANEKEIVRQEIYQQNNTIN